MMILFGFTLFEEPSKFLAELSSFTDLKIAVIIQPGISSGMAMGFPGSNPHPDGTKPSFQVRDAHMLDYSLSCTETVKNNGDIPAVPRP